MIRGKELIDARIKAEKASIKAKNDSYRETIKSSIEELNKLSSLFEDMMDTYFYLYSLDNEKGQFIWRFYMCNNECKSIDIVNAFNACGHKECAMRASYREDVCSNIYITSHGAYVGYENGSSKIEDYEFKDEELEKVVNTISILKQDFPRYADNVFTAIESI